MAILIAIMIKFTKIKTPEKVISHIKNLSFLKKKIRSRIAILINKTRHMFSKM